jgi:uncharacterized protein YjbI with pentapeptide repeats
MTVVQDHPDIEQLPHFEHGVIVREIIRDIFRNPDNGTPDNISKVGCLALVLKSNEVGGDGKGHVVWNAWRRVFPARWEMVKHQGERMPYEVSEWVNIVDFSKIDFTSDIDSRLSRLKNFSQFQFGNGANFSGSTWGAHTDFRDAVFGDNANFERTEWGSRTNFENTRWGDWANFSGSKFGTSVRFDRATFGIEADFSNTTWENGKFADTRFVRRVTFANTTWTEYAFFGTEAKEPLDFYEIDFSGARFDKEVNFSNRKFLGTTLFKQTQFAVAPIFHGCELHPGTSFFEAKFPKASGDEVARLTYQTLKLTFGKQQNIRAEQRFFRLEMDEERVGHHIKGRDAINKSQPFVALREYGTWLLYWLYKQTSDYGFSIARPLLLLAILWLMFAQIYVQYTGVEPCYIWATNCEFQRDWLNYSLQQALPLPGFDKLKHAVDGVSVAWLAAHKTLSLAALFLVGLALRNLFKLK